MRTWKQGVIGKIVLSNGIEVFLKCLKYPLAIIYKHYHPETSNLENEMFSVFLDLVVIKKIEVVKEVNITSLEKKLSMLFKMEHPSKVISISSDLHVLKYGLCNITDIENGIKKEVITLKLVNEYSKGFNDDLKKVCEYLFDTINKNIVDSENKLYHGSPVWFLNKNPIVGYSKKGNKIALLFWSGQSFSEHGLRVVGKFKAAEIVYSNISEIDTNKLQKWLMESQKIIWNYKDIRKSNGILELVQFG